MTIKSGLPIAYYFWLVLCFAIFIGFFFSSINLFYAFLISIIIAIVLFVVIAQYSCSFILNDNHIAFKYLWSGIPHKQVDLLNVKKIKFEMSYFYFFEEDFKMGIFYWFRPYDIMYVFYNNEENPITIKFNSSFRRTLRMHRYLKERYHAPYWDKKNPPQD